MTAETRGLRLEFTVLTPVIRYGEDLQVEAILTNVTDQNLVVNIWVLNFASLVLKLQRSEAMPVALAAPPTPPAADDTSGQTVLAAQESLRFLYEGQRFLGGQRLLDGNYQIRFLYDNRDGLPNEWHGAFETDWLPFRVDAQYRP